MWKHVQHINSEILSGIYLLSPIRTYCLALILTFFLVFILAFFLAPVLHSLWPSFCQSMWHLCRIYFCSLFDILQWAKNGKDKLLYVERSPPWHFFHSFRSFHISTGSKYCIYFLTVCILAFLAFCLTSTHILSSQSIRHLFWHPSWHLPWQFRWHYFFLSGIYFDILSGTPFLEFYVASIVKFSLAWALPAGIWSSKLREGREGGGGTLRNLETYLTLG